MDREGDALNTGTGEGKPAKDLSVNFVPVPYPDYPPATITLRPNERQLWRVVNASSVTYLSLAASYRRGPRFRVQWLGVVAIDGVPLSANGGPIHGIQCATASHCPRVRAPSSFCKAPPKASRRL
ncbi:MAG: hypothetical protein WDM77_16145 [Steroidobacteraceae bacterium]